MHTAIFTVADVAALEHKGVDLMDKIADYAIKWTPSVVGALVLLVLSLVLAGWVRRFVLGMLERAKVDTTLARFFSNVARWLILLLGFLAAAGTFGINITGFAAIIGAVGLAISLGFQGTLSNLAAGVLLLVFRPFKVGDSVVVAGQVGTVDAIDLFTTTLDTADNRRIIVPNGAIFGSVIENTTHHPRRRGEVRVVVAGDADTAQARRRLEEALRGALGSTRGGLTDPAPTVTLAEIAPPTWVLTFWSETPRIGEVREAVLVGVKVAMDGAGLGPKPAAPVVVVRG